MEQAGIIISVLSLASIIYTDFSGRKILNLSLVLLGVGLSLHLQPHLHPLSLGWGLLRVISFGSALITTNTYLAKKKRPKIEAGDIKLILVLSLFLSLQQLSLILLISAVGGLILNLITKQKKIPLGGILSLVTLSWMILYSV